MKKRIVKKNLILTALLLVGTLSVQADKYSYLTLKNSDGTDESVKVESLVITFSDGRLIATNTDGTQNFTLQDLSAMCFMFRGDVDGNGEVDGNDVEKLVKVIVGSEKSNSRCDVNVDEKTNIADVTTLVEILDK